MENFSKYICIGKLLTISAINANNKKEMNIDSLNFHIVCNDFSFEKNYQTQMNLVREKLFKFECLEEFIYYYPIHSGFHYVSKVVK